MISMLYRGPREDLRDCKALVQLFNDQFVKVQFDQSYVPELCFNWHDFPIQDFFGQYRITKCNFGRATGDWFKVTLLGSAEDSSVMSYVDCQHLVMNALAGREFTGKEWNGNLLHLLDRFYQHPGWVPKEK